MLQVDARVTHQPSDVSPSPSVHAPPSGSTGEGIDALRSLLMVTKSPGVGPRIKRCLVTGVARFAQTSLFSGANNFADLTNDPLLSRVLGFSEAEIRATFPAELVRLVGTLGTDVDVEALRTGTITERELAAASGIDWLSLTPGDVVQGLAMELQTGALAAPLSVNIADLKSRRVRAVPLLLQTGLLSVVQKAPPTA